MPEQNHIRILPAQVANKIAAGEVVERPASVAKELIENAVDAGANQVDVEVVAGGRKLVAVRDNGRGMTRDDALLSIERMATSKIRDVDDIESIHTLGFRGEALAAIASVSRFRLVTRSGDDAAGSEVRLSGGKLQDVSDAGAPIGTAVEVRNLFFNVPARRKFLRTTQTEMSHLRSVFLVAALARPEIGMSLRVDGQDLYTLPPGATLEERIRSLFGPEHPPHLRKTDFAEHGVHVTGYVGLPEFSRSDRNEQYIFVNGRAAAAPLVHYAIREGYHSLLPKDRHPVLFLFIEVDPSQVDVNVHPTKREVRFRRPGDVRDAVIQSIRKTLGTPDESVGPPPTMEGVGQSAPRAMSDVRLEIADLPATRAFQYPRPPSATASPDQGPFGFDGKNAETNAAAAPSSDQPERPGAPWAWCRVLGQIGGLYVVLETEAGMVLMDPHAAHERVLYERFMARLNEGKVRMQNLLMPETVELQPRDAVRVRKSLEILERMGFGLSEFGGDAFVVDAVPADFAGASAATLLVDIARHLEEGGSRSGEKRWREESITQAACKAAVKARDRLTLEEIEGLVIDLAKTEMPYTCPHGRSTLIFTSFHELNRKFGRE